MLAVGPVQANCYIVYNGDTADGSAARGAAVIDPGGSAPLILRALRENNLRAEMIFLTHGHFDHLLAAEALREETGARIVMHEDDADLSALHTGMRGVAVPDRLADVTVRGGETFSMDGLPFVWLHTPGHTPGSCVIVCGDALYTGDTLFHGDCGRCDLPGGSYPVMQESLRRLAALAGDFAVFPGHEEASTLEEERRFNADMRAALAAGGRS